MHFGKRALLVSIAFLGHGAAAAQDQLLHLGQGAPGDELGFAVDRAGDVDQDGVRDLVVGIPRDPAGVLAGEVRVVSGADGATITTINGNGSNNRFGAAVAGLGDIDQSGNRDIAVGIPSATPGGVLGAGRVRVFDGLTGDVVYTLDGTSSQEAFGTAVDDIDDVNGDGFRDLLVGAPGASPNGSFSGAVHVFSGKNGSLIRTLAGAGPGSRLGSSVSRVGDLDGDGVEDVIAGAPTENVLTGSATLFSGATGAVIFPLPGPTFHSQFGTSVAGKGDVDGDGTDDFAVGGLQVGPGLPGFVDVFSGATRMPMFRLTGAGIADGFGAAVDLAADVNGDGNADVIAGAGGLAGPGYAQVFAGPAGAPLFTLTGLGGLDRFGAAVSRAGDIDGDGNTDIVVGAPNVPNGGPGFVRVYRGLNTCNGSSTFYGTGCVGLQGFRPVLAVQGCPSPGSTVHVSLEGGLGGTTAFLLVSTTSTPIPLVPGCPALVSGFPFIVSPPLPLAGVGAGEGRVLFPAAIPPTAPPATVFAQMVLADPFGPGGASSSQGLQLLIQ